VQQDGTAKLSRSNAGPEVRLSINQFSALYIGGADPEEWLLRNEVAGLTISTARKLDAMFCDRPVHSLEWF
jgi:hypothetical protein